MYDMNIDVYALPDDPLTSELAHIASYRFTRSPERKMRIVPLRRTVPPLPSDPGSGVSFLQIKLYYYEFNIVPVSSILSEAVLSHDRSQPMLVVPWKAWGPSGSHLMYGRDQDITGVTGKHILYGHSVFDFNLYDISRDIYQPTCIQKLPNRSGGEVYGVFRGTEMPGGSEAARLVYPDSVYQHRSTKCTHRKTYFEAPGRRGRRIHLVEEDDPMVCSLYMLRTPTMMQIMLGQIVELVLGEENILHGLRFYSL